MMDTPPGPGFDWPLPPYTLLDSASPEPECEVLLRDGRTIRGVLMIFDNDMGVLEVVTSFAGSPMHVSFSQLKHLRLTRPVALKSAAPVMLESDSAYAPPELCELKAEFSDGDVLSAKTFGMLESLQGVYFYLDNGDGKYVRSFIPAGAIRHYQLGEPIGEMLVKNYAATKEQVDAGLTQQHALRTQPLGEYLKNEEIVTPEQLQGVLEKMRSQPTLKIGEALLNAGLIDQEQLEIALEKQKSDRKRPLGEILIDMGAVARNTVNVLLARKIGIPYISLKQFNIDPGTIKLVPEKLAIKYNLVPVCVVESRLVVAMENPLLHEPLNEVRFHAKKAVEPVMASVAEIQHAIQKHYGSGHFADLASELALALEGGDEESEDKELSESDSVLTRLVNKAILDAYQQGASDIHIETYPGRKNSVIRFRRDGLMVHYLELPANFRSGIVSRIKIMANLDISERRRGQDGKIDFAQFGPARIELRVATVPTTNGLEDVVLRLLMTGKPKPLDQVGLSSENFEKIKTMVSRPHGMFLVCGPTGSGKTTTLHSILSHLNTPERKIWTVEDPIEITQEGLRQVQTHTKIGWTFATAMRSFLRADPDVIMVGEMRDHETSQIAIEASLTGHLVLSTLHTNSASETVVRLLELGMDPFNFSDALLGVLAQRLTRSLCPACKKPHATSKEDIQSLIEEYAESYEQVGVSPASPEEVLASWKHRFAQGGGKFTLYSPGGCRECDNSGYKGRIGLHELLINSPQIKHLIQIRAPATKIQQVAFEEGMRTLKQDGIEKVLAGLTDIGMVRAVC
jgi:type II secretory ATPase GspE/PulE/Tfp pilus assembly ATPase PilB-like protein